MKASIGTSLLQFYRNHSTTISILLKYGIALGVFAWVILKNWDGLVKVVQRPIRAEPLILATLIYIVGLLITFLRWHFLVRTVGLPFTRYNAIRLGLVGFYFNTFLPGSIGGDVVKAYNIAKENKRRTLAVATVMIDRILGLWALIWFVAIVGTAFWILDDPLLKNSTLDSIILCTVIFVVVSMIVWFLVGLLSEEAAARVATKFEKVRRIGGSLAEFWRACWMYRKKSRAVLIAMLVTLVAHTGWVLVFHYSVKAFESPNPEIDVGTMPEHAIVVPVGMTVSAFIPLPGGIGVGEAAYGRLYKILDKPEVNGVVGCMSQRVITYSLGLFGYIIYTRMRVRREVVAEPEANGTIADSPPPPLDPLKQPLPNAVIGP